MTRLAQQAWTDLDARANLLVVPLGATEQHGPHLSLGTDTEIAKAFADQLAKELPDVTVGPAVPYGSSGEHQAFPGTISIGQDALRLVLIEIGRSAGYTFSRLLFISAHGGNATPVADAVRLLQSEGRDVRAWSPGVSWQGDAHAGFTETSVMLALRPTEVRAERSVRGETRPLAEILETLRSNGLAAVTHTGVLGDPTAATAQDGFELFLRAGHQLRQSVETWSDRAGVWL